MCSPPICSRQSLHIIHRQLLIPISASKKLNECALAFAFPCRANTFLGATRRRVQQPQKQEAHRKRIESTHESPYNHRGLARTQPFGIWNESKQKDPTLVMTSSFRGSEKLTKIKPQATFVTRKSAGQFLINFLSEPSIVAYFSSAWVSRASNSASNLLAMKLKRIARNVKRPKKASWIATPILSIEYKFMNLSGKECQPTVQSPFLY